MYNVLIVDDNNNNILTIELILEELEDIVISKAINGQEAFELCKKQKFNLIFMDIMMPVMDGFEATLKIKEVSKDVMIIALSALDDEASRNKILANGAEDYITKPINSELFLKRTKNYLKIIANRNEKTFTKKAKNPFCQSVYSRETIFYIDSQNALFEFWDFWLNGTLDVPNLSDYVRVINGFGLWLLKNDKHFTITCEESEQGLYFILSNISFIKKSIIINILKSHIPETSRYIIKDDALIFEIPKTISQVIVTSDEAKDILSTSHEEKISASEFIQNTALALMPKIEALENIENELDRAIIEFEQKQTSAELKVVCAYLDEYCETVELLVDFNHLVYAIRSLIEFLKNLDDEKIQSNNINSLCAMVFNLLEDLSSWRDNIFVKEEAVDIHYLDASLLSSCMQIEALFEEKEMDDGDNLEFF